MQAVVYIGDRLKNLRVRRALTQQELADRAGVGKNTVNRIERNEGRAAHEHASQARQCPQCRPRRAYRRVVMPSTNGHGPKRAILWAILYARVSTDEQARSGAH